MCRCLATLIQPIENPTSNAFQNDKTYWCITQSPRFYHRKQVNTNMCCIQATSRASGTQTRSVCLRRFPAGSAAASRPDECEEKVLRISQTPRDRWPGNLWHQTPKKKTASVFFVTWGSLGSFRSPIRWVACPPLSLRTKRTLFPLT